MILRLALIMLMIFAQPSFASSSCERFFEDKKFLFVFNPQHKTKYLKWAVSVPLSIAVTTMAWKQIDQHIFWPKAEAEVTDHIIDHTMRNADAYDRIIESDFRFRKIRNIELDPKATDIDKRLYSLNVQKRLLAYNLKREYEDYYSKYAQIKDPLRLTLDENEKLFGNSSLFSQFNFIFANGIKPYKGSVIAPKDQGPVNDAQKNTLYQLTHILYTKYALIDAIFTRNDREKLIQENAMAHEIYYDPYVQKLIQLRDQKKITTEQLIYYTQEDAYYSYYDAVLKTLKITILKEENGQYTDEPINWAKIKQEKLKDLE